MFLEHFTDKYQTDTLTTAFGREERAEQFGFRLLVNAFSGVSDFQADRITGSTDVDFTIVVDRLGGILDDVDQHLLAFNDCVLVCGSGIRTTSAKFVMKWLML